MSVRTEEWTSPTTPGDTGGTSPVSDSSLSLARLLGLLLPWLGAGLQGLVTSCASPDELRGRPRPSGLGAALGVMICLTSLSAVNLDFTGCCCWRVVAEVFDPLAVLDVQQLEPVVVLP